MSKLVYGLLAIVGLFAVAACAMAIAGLATSSSTQQQLSSVQRSLSVGGATGGTVVSSGSYSIYITYVVAGNPAVQTTTAVVGTYTYTALSDSTGAVSFMRLVLSPMTYTFTAAATATVGQMYFGNFSPAPGFSGFSGSVLCKSYTLSSSTVATIGPFVSIALSNAVTTGGPSAVVFYPTATSITITSGYTISLPSSLQIILGTVPN